MIATITPAPLPVPGSVPGIDIPSLQSQFTQLASDFTRSDVKVTATMQLGKAPRRGWAETFDGFANRLDSARTQYSLVRPGDVDLLSRLGEDVRDLARMSGEFRAMNASRTRMAPGWETALDAPIANAQEAVRILGETAASGTTPAPVPVVPGPVTGPVDGTAPADGTAPTPGGLGALEPTELVVADVRKAVDLVNQSIARIQTVPADDHGDESTKQARIGAYQLNMQAQQLLEPHFDGAASGVTSTLRQADAYLEDANWQLAKKPSPDGRFDGVDIPGALASSQSALAALQQLTQVTPA